MIKTQKLGSESKDAIARSNTPLLIYRDYGVLLGTYPWARPLLSNVET